MRRSAVAIIVTMLVLGAMAGCELFGRPMIIDECGNLIQKSRFLKCVEVVPAKGPCPPGVVKQAVTRPCKESARLGLLDGTAQSLNVKPVP
jgi:hypothetical protein